jgi:ABC-type uncharacterized transport system permease subunit
MIKITRKLIIRGVIKMPKTRLGKWSVGLIILFFLLFALFQFLVASGQRGGATFFSNLVLAIPILAAEISLVCLPSLPG